MLCPRAARIIITVLLVLVPTVFMYIRPSATLAADKLVILFIVMPPLLNPLIYTLRNSEVENAMRKIFRVKGSSGGEVKLQGFS